MKSFDLSAHVDNIYASYPAAERRPVIGITGNYEELTCKLGKGYYRQDRQEDCQERQEVIPPVYSFLSSYYVSNCKHSNLILFSQLFYIFLTILLHNSMKMRTFADKM